MRSDQHQPPSLRSKPPLNPSESKGLFTSTNPETRRVKPDAQGRVTVKVVYVVLEAQYQSALTTAVKRINSTNKQVRVGTQTGQRKRRATQADVQQHRRVTAAASCGPHVLTFTLDRTAHASRLLGFSCARGHRSSSQERHVPVVALVRCALRSWATCWRSCVMRQTSRTSRTMSPAPTCSSALSSSLRSSRTR